MITIEGLRALHLEFDKKVDVTNKAAMQGLREGGMNIIADAKENLRGNHSVVTGQLRAMGKVQKVEGSPNEIDVGFFAKGSKEGYAYFVEYGRRKTKTTKASNPTLFQAIKAWLKKKGSTGRGVKSAFKSAAAFSGMSTERYLDSLAARIAKSIHKRGTKPHPFFAPAVEKNKSKIEDAISKSVKEVL